MYRTLRENHLIVPPEYCFYRSRLPLFEQKIYDDICRAIGERKREARFFMAVTEASRIMNEVFQAIYKDQHMFFFLDKTKVQGAFGPFQATFTWDFLFPEREIEDLIRKIDRRIEKLALPRRGTELSIEVAIHNAMQDMELVTGQGGWEDHCIVGPLLYGHTVCEGSARLFALLCCMCGVYSFYISGVGTNDLENGPHAWNLVRLGSLYAHVDVYWDCLQWKDRKGLRCYTFLNLNDRQIGLDHSWEKEGIPPCPVEKYSYFVLNHAWIDSAAEFRSYLKQEKKKGRTSIMVRLGPHVTEEDCMRDATFLASVFGFGSSFWHSFDRRQRVFRLWTQSLGRKG